MISSLRHPFAWISAALVAVALAVLPSCQTEEITGRRQWIVPGLSVNQESEMQLGADAYKQVKEQSKICTDKAIVDQVQRVGNRIAQASSKAGDYQWEFTVIDDPKTVNAFCLPGGKVAVYTGILPVTQDDAGLAVVLGHEVAHATAHHGVERMTRTSVLELVNKGGQSALTAAFANKDPSTVDAVMKAFGVGAQVGIELPFSRKEETSADEVGIIYMARAGYDPAQAIEFWKRMSTMAGSGTTPQFLSTHPAHETRVATLTQWLPKAQAEYAKATQGGGATPAAPAPAAAPAAQK
jgi:metalloendopeptidase OMA1, mitochondrial